VLHESYGKHNTSHFFSNSIEACPICFEWTGKWLEMLLSPRRVENDASAKDPDLISVSCDHPWPPGSRSWLSHALALWTTCIKIVSFIFTTRRVCIARTMPSQDVCPSVCHTPVFCQHRWTCLQIFLPWGSATIIVFHIKQHSNIPTGTTPS